MSVLEKSPAGKLVFILSSNTEFKKSNSKYLNFRAKNDIYNFF